MENYKLKIILKSPALIGSGLGYGALIDSDIVFDEVGIPYIPSKRIKGCLRNSAQEVQGMLNCADIKFNLDVHSVFGTQGNDQSAPIYFSNLYIDDYEANQDWLRYFMNRSDCQAIVSRDLILETFTELRHQTAINDQGIADDHTLRTIRVMKKGHEFIGDIHIEFPTQTIIDTLNLAATNFRCLGTKRNRGFGEIECYFLDQDLDKLKFPKYLEDICTV